ncbi:MAG: hypothetical protein JXA61_01760 [Bacteroidales bacterium]|nr:hypothetical protein [Bacteroidales bacterium]
MKLRVFRSLFAVFFLTGLHLAGTAQEIEVTESRIDIFSGTTSLHKIIGRDPDHYYVVKFHSNQFHLERLDKDLNLLLEEPIKLHEGLRTYELETVVHFHNDLYIFVSRRGLNNIVLYYQRIDKTNLLPVAGFTEIANIDFIKGNWADFHFALSRHETKLLIVCRTKLLWSGAQFNEFYVLGEDLNPIWHKKDSYQYTGQGPRDNRYLVDETGNVSILSLLQRESIFSLFRENRNLYTIYRYTQNGEEFNEYPVTLGERYIRGINIIAGEFDELICAGLYSEIFKTGMRGTFFFKIDPVTGRIYDNYLNEFDDALLSQLAVMKEPTLQDQELIKYVITDMVLRENGKIIIIAEQIFDQNYNTYNNLIVTCYESSGQVYWSRVIDKNQDINAQYAMGSSVETADYRQYIMETGYFDQDFVNYCSYALMAPLDQTGIIIFYNDDVRNLDNPEQKKRFNRPRKSYILAVAIDEFGNITRQPLVKWERKKLFPEPIRFYDTLHNTIIIPAFRYRKYNYYKITATNIQ